MALHPNRGFTLIELVVVVAILAVLAGVLVPMVSNEVDGARAARAQMDMKTVANAFLSYRAHTGVWPSNTATGAATTMNEPLTTFACFYANTFTKTGWNGPYLNTGFKVGTAWNVAGSGATDGLKDPWGAQFLVYRFAVNGAMGAGGGYAIVSKGPNGVLDTSTAKIATDDPVKDDVVFIVTRRL